MVMHHSPRLSLELLVSNDAHSAGSIHALLPRDLVVAGCCWHGHSADVGDLSAGLTSGTGSTASALRELSAADGAGNSTEGWAIAAFPSKLQAVPEEHAGAQRPDESGRGGGEEVAKR